MKKETPEEGLKRIRIEYPFYIDDFAFEQGVKYQREQNKNRHSDEEIKRIAINAYLIGKQGLPVEALSELFTHYELFKQNEK